jgi:hypothetical protein
METTKSRPSALSAIRLQLDVFTIRHIFEGLRLLVWALLQPSMALDARETRHLGLSGETIGRASANIALVGG